MPNSMHFIYLTINFLHFVNSMPQNMKSVLTKDEMNMLLLLLRRNMKTCMIDIGLRIIIT